MIFSEPTPGIVTVLLIFFLTTRIVITLGDASLGTPLQNSATRVLSESKIKIRFQFPDDIQPIESMAPMVGWSERCITVSFGTALGLSHCSVRTVKNDNDRTK